MADQAAPLTNEPTEPQQPKKKRHVIRNVLIVALIVVIALAAVSCAGGSNDAVVDTSDGTAASQNVTNTNTSDGQQAGESKYSITDEQVVEENYLTYIKGSFTNTSGKELTYVQLSYNLFDADGNQIGTAFANTSNLADGTTWKFEAMCSQDSNDISSFRLGDVTAY